MTYSDSWFSLQMGKHRTWERCSCHGLTSFLLIELEENNNTSPKPHHSHLLACEPARRKSRAQLWHERERLPTEDQYTWSSWLYWDAANEQQMDFTQGVYLGKVTVSSYFSFRKDQETKRALADTLNFTIVFSSASILTELLWPCIPLHFTQCNHGSVWNTK